MRQRLDALIGTPIGPRGPSVAPDPVNQPMIRHWAAAFEDDNPVYTDPEFAAASSFGGIVGPPCILQTWTMATPKITGLPEMGVVARKLWAVSGLTPADIQTAFLYDHFTPFVLVQLEELGFCGRGEAKDFATIENLSLGGRLPINTSGGLLGEAYIHGMNGITEAVRQIRGTSCNQVADVQHVLVTSGTGVPTSGLILARA